MPPTVVEQIFRIHNLNLSRSLCLPVSLHTTLPPLPYKRGLKPNPNLTYTQLFYNAGVDTAANSLKISPLSRGFKTVKDSRKFDYRKNSYICICKWNVMTRIWRGSNVETRQYHRMEIIKLNLFKYHPNMTVTSTQNHQIIPI